MNSIAVKCGMAGFDKMKHFDPYMEITECRKVRKITTRRCKSVWVKIWRDGVITRDLSCVTVRIMSV